MLYNSFRKLSESERRCKLASTLFDKTRGMVGAPFIIDIVNTVDIDKQYKISVINKAKEFAEKITNSEVTVSHSWAGSYGHKETVTSVICQNKMKSDCIIVGCNKANTYSDNGNMGEPNVEISEPDFDVNSVIAVIFEINDWNNMQGFDNFNKHEYGLAIYIPDPDNDPYIVTDPRIQCILNNFAIK
jgi:hypothetical protein